jgi:hypothetical protein
LHQWFHSTSLPIRALSVAVGSQHKTIGAKQPDLSHFIAMSSSATPETCTTIKDVLDFLEKKNLSYAVDHVEGCATQLGLTHDDAVPEALFSFLDMWKCHIVPRKARVRDNDWDGLIEALSNTGEEHAWFLGVLGEARNTSRFPKFIRDIITETFQWLELTEGDPIAIASIETKDDVVKADAEVKVEPTQALPARIGDAAETTKLTMKHSRGGATRAIKLEHTHSQNMVVEPNLRLWTKRSVKDEVKEELRQELQADYVKGGDLEDTNSRWLHGEIANFANRLEVTLEEVPGLKRVKKVKHLKQHLKRWRYEWYLAQKLKQAGKRSAGGIAHLRQRLYQRISARKKNKGASAPTLKGEGGADLKVGDCVCAAQAPIKIEDSKWENGQQLLQARHVDGEMLSVFQDGDKSQWFPASALICSKSPLTAKSAGGDWIMTNEEFATAIDRSKDEEKACAAAGIGGAAAEMELVESVSKDAATTEKKTTPMGRAKLIGSYPEIQNQGGLNDSEVIESQMLTEAGSADTSTSNVFGILRARTEQKPQNSNKRLKIDHIDPVRAPTIEGKISFESESFNYNDWLFWSVALLTTFCSHPS